MDGKAEHLAVSAHDDSTSEDASQDTKDMARLGKKQQFTRHFDFFSILGFACLATIAWEAFLFTFIYGLANGGPAGLIYGAIFVWAGYAAAVLSLAELMSMWPTSGGQYHWCYTLSPPRLAPILSYICGWQSVIAFQAGTISSCYLCATMIQGLALLNHPDYGYQRWHGTFIMYAVLTWAILASTIGNRLLPKLNSGALIVHFAGFIVVIVVVAVLSPTEASTDEVFGVWLNNGYPTQGVSFLVRKKLFKSTSMSEVIADLRVVAFWVGLQGIVFAWVGADAPVHMAEEVRNASRTIPWAMTGSIIINGILSFAVLLVVLYFGPTGDALAEAVASPTGFPYLAIFEYATGSAGSATGLIVIIIMMSAVCVALNFTTASRELWAFARDNAVPGSKTLSRINKNMQLPLWTMLVTAIATTLLALVNIGSAVALNAIISLVLAAYTGSYVLPISMVLWRRIQALRGKGPELPRGPWRLGISGIFINILALGWIAIIFVFSFFPNAPLPALTIQTMNRSCLAYGAICIFAIVCWFIHGKRFYKGPVRDAANGEIEAVLDWTVRRDAAKM